ncbi:MAG: assembly protein [Gammaproteobacteria bacterium]|nr:assembly protein [Gammaproteobacteria bacterium]
MATYGITGKLGAGKTLAAVGRMRDYILQGRRIATNLDIYLEHLLPATSRCTITRIPDKPTHDDLMAIGLGNDSTDETKNGALILDECASFLNSRDFADKDRSGFINWMLHARKRGWDVFFIVQDLGMLDKQIRDALIEHWVVCKRIDRIAIPFLTLFTKLFGFRLMPPRVHLAIVRYGIASVSPVSDRWVYRGASLYQAYDTRQVFRPINIKSRDAQIVGPATILSAWHIRGRYIGWWQMYKTIILGSFFGGALCAFLLVVGVGVMLGYQRPAQDLLELEKVSTVPLAGFYFSNGKMIATLGDGRSVESYTYKLTPIGARVKIGDEWFTQGK